jgi:hypothetical protein
MSTQLFHVIASEMSLHNFAVQRIVVSRLFSPKDATRLQCFQHYGELLCYFDVANNYGIHVDLLCYSDVATPK